MAPKKDFSMEDAMRMAKSPAGQQLMNELQKRNGSALQQAADKKIAKVIAAKKATAMQPVRRSRLTPATEP